MQNTPPMPPPEMMSFGSGTETAWGGAEIPEEAPYTAADAEILPPPPTYSFLDQPGASDALVAFGAAMLKAPDFNTGLGDAALAVNEVARSQRMPTEQDYARARQLGLVKRIASGKGTTQEGMSIDRSTLYRDAEGNTWFDATGPNGEPGLYNQETGQFTTEGVPGLTRDVYDYGSNRSRRAAGKDADIEAEFSQRLPSIAATAVQFDNLYRLAADPSTGIDSSFYTRVSRQLETLLPGLGFGDLDANNITEFNNRIEKAALDYAAGAFKGQGQVTENEREMIKRAVGQPGTLTKESALLVFKIMRDAELRKLQQHRAWMNDQNLRDSYGGNFSRYQSDMLLESTMQQISQPPGGSESPQQGSGGRKPLTDIFN